MDDLFEWDIEKAETNLRKHFVSFEEATTVFADPLSSTIVDSKHSAPENRFLIVGHSVAGRQLVVSHTDRGDKIRIISARLATPSEIRSYERK